MIFIVAVFWMMIVIIMLFLQNPSYLSITQSVNNQKHYTDKQ